MATVTQLADRVCRITRLSTTGDDRLLVIDALNEAYAAACEASGCMVKSSTETLTVDDNEYSLSSDFGITDMASIKLVLFNSSTGSSYPITPINTESMGRRLGSTTGNSLVYEYALFGSDIMKVHPTPGSADTITIYYEAYPKTLVESVADATTEESTPSEIPSRFHREILQNYAISAALDMDQRVDDAEKYIRRFEKGISRLIEKVNRDSDPLPAVSTITDRNGANGVNVSPDRF